MDWKGVLEMQKILDFTNQHFREDIKIIDIARAVGYSPGHCNVLFKRCYGETLASYLRRLRMEAAKDELKNGKAVKDVTESLAFSSVSGFRRAFRDQFGIAPSTYVKGGELKERYVKSYEYKGNDNAWGRGDNPTSDGLWEFSYFDPATNEYSLMKWNGKRFFAPYEKALLTDRSWYCYNRDLGYGLHPAKELQAVRSFVCPHSGCIELLCSVGRICKVYDKGNPCTVQLFLNDSPLFPEEGPMILDSTVPVFLFPTCTVHAGDKIHLRLDSMGNIHADGVMVYRQQIGYLSITDDRG